MKKVLCIVILLSIIISITSCQTGGDKEHAAGEVVKPGEGAAAEISIIVMPDMYSWAKSDIFANYEKDFEKKYGVKVNYIVLDDGDPSVALMTKLAVKNGPELILGDDPDVMKLVENGAVADINDKVENLNKIYDSFIHEQTYFLPIGIDVRPIILKRDMLEELGIDIPAFDWTYKDYYKMKEKWLAGSERIFTRNELVETSYRYITELNLFDYQNKKAHINTDEFKRAISKIKKEINSGNYKLNKNYKYENYYNLLFEYSSQEFMKDRELVESKEYLEQDIQNTKNERRVNLLSAEEVEMAMYGNMTVRPNCMMSDAQIWGLGFLVNRNGANLELAYEYLNGLLSDELQLKIFEDQELDLYPVSEAIEDRIEEIEKQKNSDEAIQLKSYVLDKVKKGEYQLLIHLDTSVKENYLMIMKDILKFIFADKPYTDAELSAELQKLENKYNIWLSE